MIPRKRCPKCAAYFEGPAVVDMQSCDQCGNGYLTVLQPKSDDADLTNLPRGGGAGAITHTRDGY